MRSFRPTGQFAGVRQYWVKWTRFGSTAVAYPAVPKEAMAVIAAVKEVRERIERRVIMGELSSSSLTA
jgi:hypothetical protein